MRSDQFNGRHLSGQIKGIFDRLLCLLFVIDCDYLFKQPSRIRNEGYLGFMFHIIEQEPMCHVSQRFDIFPVRQAPSLLLSFPSCLRFSQHTICQILEVSPAAPQA